jgi:hypothetical protein
MQTGMQTSLGLPFFLLTCSIIVNILLGSPGDIEILMQQWFLLGSSGVFGSYLKTQVGLYVAVTKKWYLSPALHVAFCNILPYGYIAHELYRIG